MTTTIVETFTPMDIANVGIKFKNNPVALEFGCTGVISAETELATKYVKCGVYKVKEKSKPVQANVKVSAHTKKETIRRLFGLDNDGLKAGVYAYDANSSSGDFALTADVIDDFDDITKLIAFPKCTSATGLQFTVDNTSDEYALVEYSFTAMFTEIGGKARCYVEAFLDELADEETAKQWRTNFTPELVELTEEP